MRPGPVKIEVSVAWGPDARPRVLLQLPDSYVLLLPHDVRDLVFTMLEVADTCDELATP